MMLPGLRVDKCFARISVVFFKKNVPGSVGVHKRGAENDGPPQPNKSLFRQPPHTILTKKKIFASSDDMATVVYSQYRANFYGETSKPSSFKKYH